MLLYIIYQIIAKYKLFKNYALEIYVTQLELIILIETILINNNIKFSETNKNIWHFVSNVKHSGRIPTNLYPWLVIVFKICKYSTTRILQLTFI